MSQPHVLRALPNGSVALLDGELKRRAALNRAYVMGLDSEKLLQNYLLEAGLWSARSVDHLHTGWESPTCQLRGHFLGHWLSAAAAMWAMSGDAEAKAKADAIVNQLALCQEANGGEWAGSIPEKYLDWIARGRQVWAPQYTLHKTLMGLYDMYALTGNQQALAVLERWAQWFLRWSRSFTRQQFDDILDVETGGMLEVWANLYGATNNPDYLELLQRYDRPRLFDKLLAGQDALTNEHANTTIPEILGAARAWEVTGEPRWRDIVFAYWDQAVTKRGAFITGGQTTGEIWTPPNQFSARLSEKNQEHCTVYNMMLLAEVLTRWTGDLSYADYWERNLYNGILAAQHPETGMIAYFLPLEPGAKKAWGTPTADFWCCHGTLVQTHASHTRAIYYEHDDGLVVTQYLPSALNWTYQDRAVKVQQTYDTQTNLVHRPKSIIVDLRISCEEATPFSLTLRMPWWLAGQATIELNGEPLAIETQPGKAVELKRTWGEDYVRITLPKQLVAEPMPDDPSMVAFMDGPIALAGLCDEERTLYGDPATPSSFLAVDNEREWIFWLPGYKTRGQPRNIRFIPLYRVVDQQYTTYFPMQEHA